MAVMSLSIQGCPADSLLSLQALLSSSKGGSKPSALFPEPYVKACLQRVHGATQRLDELCSSIIQYLKINCIPGEHVKLSQDGQTLPGVIQAEVPGACTCSPLTLRAASTAARETQLQRPAARDCTHVMLVVQTPAPGDKVERLRCQHIPSCRRAHAVPPWTQCGACVGDPQLPAHTCRAVSPGTGASTSVCELVRQDMCMRAAPRVTHLLCLLE